MSSMIRFTLVLLSVFVPHTATAQTASQDSLEALIRRLDRAEAEGLRNRDSVALRRIWARDFTVNNPRNSITRGSEEVIALIRNGTIDYSSSEVITPVRKAPFAGQTVRRRFTHFWMLRDGQWRLTARHANVVCPP
jgi:hypothetical protein